MDEMKLVEGSHLVALCVQQNLVVRGLMADGVVRRHLNVEMIPIHWNSTIRRRHELVLHEP
jgi:hypothetical protein